MTTGECERLLLASDGCFVPPWRIKGRPGSQYRAFFENLCWHSKFYFITMSVLIDGSVWACFVRVIIIGYISQSNTERDLGIFEMIFAANREFWGNIDITPILLFIPTCICHHTYIKQIFITLTRKTHSCSFFKNHHHLTHPASTLTTTLPHPLIIYREHHQYFIYYQHCCI